MRHHCFASPFVNPADERHNGKCDNAKNDTWQQCRHTWKKPDSNSHHREYQKSEDINREHHFAIDPACSSCLLPFLPHPPEVVPEIEPLLILLPFHHAQCINPRWNISATFATIRAIAIRTILASFLLTSSMRSQNQETLSGWLQSVLIARCFSVKKRVFVKQLPFSGIFILIVVMVFAASST